MHNFPKPRIQKCEHGLCSRSFLFHSRNAGSRPGVGIRKRVDTELRAAKDLFEVEEVKGIRLLPSSGADEAEVEYLVGWKGDLADTWEPTVNLSPDLLRDFEETWWEACRKQDKETLEKFLRGGGEVLAQVGTEIKPSDIFGMIT